MFSAARYRTFRSSVGHMMHRSIFSSPKSRMFFLARIALAGLFCLSFSTNSFAKDDAWPRCRGADPDARIAGCSRVIARGGKESKRNRVVAFINRGGAYQAKGDFDRAIADLDKALQLDPKSALALSDRASIYRARGDLDRTIADYDAVIAALEAALKLNPQLGWAKKALDDVNELIARNAAAVPTAPVSPPAAAPITMPSDRWIVALLGLALSAFIVWIVWFWLKRTKGIRLAETTSGSSVQRHGYAHDPFNPLPSAVKAARSLLSLP